jgi:hypothetical protein
MSPHHHETCDEPGDYFDRFPKLPIAQIRVGTGHTNPFFRVEGKSELLDTIV